MPLIEDSLVYLFNTSFETSQFPDPLKIARVSPIFKNGDKTEKSVETFVYLFLAGSTNTVSCRKLKKKNLLYY